MVEKHRKRVKIYSERASAPHTCTFFRKNHRFLHTNTLFSQNIFSPLLLWGIFRSPLKSKFCAAAHVARVDNVVFLFKINATNRIKFNLRILNRFLYFENSFIFTNGNFNQNFMSFSVSHKEIGTTS